MLPLLFLLISFIATHGHTGNEKDMKTYLSDALLLTSHSSSTSLRRERLSAISNISELSKDLASLLENEWEHRSSFRATKKEVPISSHRVHGLHTNIKPGSVAKMRANRRHYPYAPKEPHQKNETLLAIIHPSSVGWPARLYILDTVLISLDSSLNTVEDSNAKFDLLIVLDSSGEPRSKHDCNAKSAAMLIPTAAGRASDGKSSNRFLCDSKQFLEYSSIPFIISRVS